MSDGRRVRCNHKGALMYWCEACCPVKPGDKVHAAAFGGGALFEALVLRIESGVTPILRAGAPVGTAITEWPDLVAPEGQECAVGSDWTIKAITSRRRGPDRTSA